MRWCLALLAWTALFSVAEADTSLEDVLTEAKACTDASIRTSASRSCDTAGDIAASAINMCQTRWNALAVKVVGPPPANALRDQSNAYWRSRKEYLDGMEYEYSKIAELKAMAIQADAGGCARD